MIPAANGADAEVPKKIKKKCFYVIQILREINFADTRSFKTTVFAIFGLRLWFIWLISAFKKCKNSYKSIFSSAWSGLQFLGLGRALVQTIGLGPSQAFNDFNFSGLRLFGLCLERAFGLKLLNIFLKINIFFNFHLSIIEAFDEYGYSMH